MTCSGCPGNEVDYNLQTQFFKCPICGWVRPDDKCSKCIDEHLMSHEDSVGITLDFYNEMFDKDFKSTDELDTYILLNNINNNKD